MITKPRNQIKQDVCQMAKRESLKKSTPSANRCFANAAVKMNETRPSEAFISKIQEKKGGLSWQSKLETDYLWKGSWKSQLISAPKGAKRRYFPSTSAFDASLQSSGIQLKLLMIMIPDHLGVGQNIITILTYIAH